MRGLWLLLATGCLHDALVPCGDLACPSDAVCAVDRCIPREALVACDGMAEDAPCTTTHITAGACRAGECRPVGCGNGVLEPGEACDDGNASDGDTCSAHCDEVDACPPLGSTPRYSRLLHQPIRRECSEYNEAIDSNVAIALCDNGLSVNQGPIDGPLTQIPSITSMSLEYLHAHVAPEGDRIYVNHYVTNGSEFEEHTRGDNDWPTTRVISNPDVYMYSVGPPTRGPRPHVMVPVGLNTLAELEIDDTDIAKTVRMIGAASLGVETIDRVTSFSPDGLRMVFVGGTNMTGGAYYTDRPSIDADFRAAVLIGGLSGIEDPFMTANCGRIYFSAIGSVFYVQQL